MHRNRFFLACVISLGVSLRGFAGVIDVDVPCPMMQAAEDAGTHAAMPAAKPDDCCGDAATLAKTGKSCNMSVTCHAEGQALPSDVALLKVAAVSSIVIRDTHQDPASWDPSFVWRPPALI